MFHVKPIPILTEHTIKRFWSKVPKGLSTNDCWLWQGLIIPIRQNRAIFQFGSNPQHKFIAARIMWYITYKEDPVDYLICHMCDNPQCVNPNHMYKGTPKSKATDRDSRGRGLKGKPIHPNTHKSLFGDNNWTRKHPERVRRGENGGEGAKLTTDQVIQIRKERPKYSLNELAKRYKVSKKLILNIVQGKAWKHIPITPEYN